ncbi:MAG: phosphoribosyltransferase family protein [Thermodesulfobacteriota bacterium]
MGKLVDDPALRNRIYVFRERTDAGRRLAQYLQKFKGRAVHLFAIPAGGVPVAAEIARALNIPLDLIIVRKIQLPWTTEAGFGALDPDGEVILNQALLRRAPLSPEEIDTQRRKTLATLQEREARLRGGRAYPDLAGRPTLIVDDGLASGYTMRAAVRFLKGKNAGPLIVAVPTGAEHTVQELLPLVDTLVCLNVRGGWAFAVAEAYEKWYDVDESEVIDILKNLAQEI